MTDIKEPINYGALDAAQRLELARNPELFAAKRRIAELEGLLRYVRESAIYDNTVQAERIDAALSGKQSKPKGCTKPGCFPYCDCGGVDEYVPDAHQDRPEKRGKSLAEFVDECEQRDPEAMTEAREWVKTAAPLAAAPSEDGREVPDVVGYRVEWKTNPKGSVRRTLAEQKPTIELLELDYPNGELIGYEELMTVSQYSRIVAAKDAEIAEWKLRCQYNADTAHDVAVERDELRAALLKVSKDGDKLRADLTAQPARQVGGDEDRGFDYSVLHEYASKHGLDYNELCATARAALAPASSKLQVFYGSMPESNGKSNWTAILHNGDITTGMTIERSEYPDRVRYQADRVRYLIGELKEEPFILDYDADKHSGYVAPAALAPAAACVMPDAFAIALKIREAMDRQACPDAWMRIAVETAEKVIGEEVARLNRNSIPVELLEQLISDDCVIRHIDDYYHIDGWRCVHCLEDSKVHSEFKHAEDCPTLKLRALLGKEGE